MTETRLLERGMEYANHRGATADAICNVCGKPIGADCSLLLNRGIVCEDPEHKVVLEDWEMIVRSSSEFGADMSVRNLECQ